MKNLYSLKNLLLAACVALTGAATAQNTSHPFAFPKDAVTPATYISSNNYYKNYVGLRFQVSAPLTISGDKGYTAAYDYTDTTLAGNWGGAPRNFIDSPVKFGPVNDTDGCTPYAPNYFDGKIAIVWRGNCFFSEKALAAQNAGALACVIVNNVSGGPVGMAATAPSGPLVHIPVYMISLADGMDITSVLNSGGVAKMTIILNWGVGNRNDLGFVPAGYSTSANFAMPLSQMMAASHPDAYKGINGAFIANYGLNTATNVKLHSNLSFTPTGGASSLLYSDSVGLPSFPAIDSIYTFFGPEYNIPTVTSTGRFDLKYNITSDSTDAFLGDNSYTHSFYATDNIWSKGRYDFAAKKPITPIYRGPGGTDPYIWGVPYYVANGGSVIKTAQFSVSSGPGTLPGGQQMLVYCFKWNDTLGGSADSLMEVGEMELVGAGIKTFNGSSDSSFQTFTVAIGDTINGDTTGTQVILDANSWYVIAPEVPATGGTPWAMGMDGTLNAYPRAYGRKHFHNYFEAYNPIWFSDRANQTLTPNDPWFPIAFPGIANYVGVDSVVFDNQKDLLPGVAFTTSDHVNAVTTVKTPFAKISLYPNPATDNINIAVSLEAVAEQVTYTVINTGGQFVSREIHKNVKDEVYNFNTSNLASGNYYILVSSGSKFTSKKFTVIK